MGDTGSFSSRYSKICNEFNKHHYHIFGCGAIGSSAAVCIAKHDAQYIDFYDNDLVSEENIGISMYDISDVNTPKVTALKSILENTGTSWEKNFMGHKTWIGNDLIIRTPIKGLRFGILAFDNMFSRLNVAKMCFEKLGFDYLIDARMGREQIQLYTVKDLETYEKYWYPDSEASTDTCQEKGTPDVSMFSGALITSQIRKIINKSFYPEEICLHIPSMGLECTTMVK